MRNHCPLTSTEPRRSLSWFGQRGVRCSLLRPDPAQRGRLEEIRDNLHDRIAEAEREAWLGEIEGLKVSLGGTEDKLAQIDTSLQRQDQAVRLGMPAFPDIAGRSVPDPEGQQ